MAERADEVRHYDQGSRWGRRFFVALAMLVLLLIVGFWRWTSNGRRQLQRQVAAYRAAGKPIELAEFVVIGVADEDNFVIPFREAAALLDTNSDAWKAYSQKSHEIAVPLTEKERTLVGDIVAANAAVARPRELPQRSARRARDATRHGWERGGRADVAGAARRQHRPTRPGGGAGRRHPPPPVSREPQRSWQK